MVMEYVRHAALAAGLTQSAIVAENKDAQSKIEKEERLRFMLSNRGLRRR